MKSGSKAGIVSVKAVSAAGQKRKAEGTTEVGHDGEKRKKSRRSKKTKR